MNGWEEMRALHDLHTPFNLSKHFTGNIERIFSMISGGRYAASFTIVTAFVAAGMGILTYLLLQAIHKYAPLFLGRLCFPTAYVYV